MIYEQGSLVSCVARVVTAFAVALMVATSAQADEICGVASGIIDGDTYILVPTTNSANGSQPRGDTITVRMAFIDAPESDQTVGFSAKVELIRLIEHRPVCVVDLGRDIYRRTVGLTYLKDEDIGLSMLERGMAWHYKKYAGRQDGEDSRRYAAAESAARQQRKGIWNEAVPQAPWEWRKQKANNAAAKR